MLVRAKRQVFASDKPKVTLAKEKKRVDRKKGEEERREEAMVALLVFILATLKKLLDGSKMYICTCMWLGTTLEMAKKSSLHGKKYSSAYKCSLGTLS